MHYKDGRMVYLGSKTSIKCQAGVCILAQTLLQWVYVVIFHILHMIMGCGAEHISCRDNKFSHSPKFHTCSI
jgi:hypothetical protein